MLFNTLDFVFFLPIVVLLYFAVPPKFRWILLLVASYYFYASWKLEYLFLIIFSTLVDYFTGLKMAKIPDRKSRFPLLLLSLCTNLGLLFFFKYYNFASDNLNVVFESIGFGLEIPLQDFLLPVGISFYTFQTLSYSIDVYLGRQKAEKHLGYFALYVSFFPQLVAGPIERYSRLTPQLKAHNIFTYDNFVNGMRLILYGLFVKMVIADNLSIYVNKVYENPLIHSTLDTLQGVFLFSFQIYSDFYGYSLIAIGSALLMGIKLMDNFKTPYLSKSIAEFWQRWHVSLSTWFRDYLYYPLGGNRVSKIRWIGNILTVFLISGLWHGANWTFLIWGGIFGLIYLGENYLNRYLKLDIKAKSSVLIHILLSLKTFIFITLIWIFFRSQDLNEVSMIFYSLIYNLSFFSSIQVPSFVWLFLVLFIVSDILLYNKRFDSWLGAYPFIIRWSIYSFLIFSIIAYAGIENIPFIYFQF